MRVPISSKVIPNVENEPIPEGLSVIIGHTHYHLVFCLVENKYDRTYIRIRFPKGADKLAGVIELSEKMTLEISRQLNIKAMYEDETLIREIKNQASIEKSNDFLSQEFYKKFTDPRLNPDD